MNYEFRVWNNQKSMPKVKAEKAPNRLDAMRNAILDQTDKGDPNILIDTKGTGEGAIESIDIGFYNSDVEEHLDEDMAIVAVKRFIKMSIKGNLYLPPDTSLTDAVKGLAGIGKDKGDENKLRDLRLLSNWAASKPDNLDENEPYYRGIIVWIMTKAGDFRVITANNMYVQSYCEDYSSGEMGTFELELQQKIDENSKFTVDGLTSEPVSFLSKVGKAISATADVAAKVGDVGGAVLVAGVETAEKFTGETELTRKLKKSGEAASSAGNVTKSLKDFDKKNMGESIKNVSESTNDLVQKSNAAHNNAAVTLAEKEKLYLSAIKKDPDAYEAYKNASLEEKDKLLDKAAQKKLDRAQITKRYEESAIDMDKVKDYEDKYGSKK